VSSRGPDIGKARALVGFEPRVRLEQGLEKTLEFFRHALGCMVSSELQGIEGNVLGKRHNGRALAPMRAAKGGGRGLS
jgi:hypothetical protein